MISKLHCNNICPVYFIWFGDKQSNNFKPNWIFIDLAFRSLITQPGISIDCFRHEHLLVKNAHRSLRIWIMGPRIMHSSEKCVLFCFKFWTIPISILLKFSEIGPFLSVLSWWCLAVLNYIVLYSIVLHLNISPECWSFSYSNLAIVDFRLASKNTFTAPSRITLYARQTGSYSRSYRTT